MDDATARRQQDERLQIAIREAESLLSRMSINTYGAFLGRTEQQAVSFARESLPALLQAARRGVELSRNSGALAGGSQGAQGEAVYAVAEDGVSESGHQLYTIHSQRVPNADNWKLFQHPAERAAVPDGWRATIQEAIDCIADVAHFKGNLAVGTYRHIGSKLSALLTAAPQPPEGARAVPDGMTLVPSRFVELVRAAHGATHPRAAPQLIADAIEELATPTLAGKKGA